MKNAHSSLLSAIVIGTLAFAAQNASAAVDCSGLTLNNYKINALSSGQIKMNYSFSGTCKLPLSNGGLNVSVPIPTTIEAEVINMKLKSSLVSESVKFNYGGKTGAVTTMATCTSDPIFDPLSIAQCSAKHLTGAPPLGEISESDIVFSRGRGGNAQKLVLDKLAADQKLWYNTPSATPIIVSPKPGEVVDPKALKIQIKLPSPHPQWQACCNLNIAFKADNGWNGISSNLKIDASMAQGNTIYLDLASLLTEAQKNVLAGQNMNHADMQLYVVDSVNPSASIEHDESKVPQHNSIEQTVEFKLPRLKLGPSAPPAAPQNPYKSKPVIASPVAGNSYVGDVFVRAQKLAKDLTDDGYMCCTIAIERKVNGAWGGYSMGSMAVKTDVDSAGVNLAIADTGEYRIKLRTVAYNNSAFTQESDWVQFKFTKPAPPASGKAPAGNAATGNVTKDAPKSTPLFVPVVPKK